MMGTDQGEQGRQRPGKRATAALQATVVATVLATVLTGYSQGPIGDAETPEPLNTTMGGPAADARTPGRDGTPPASPGLPRTLVTGLEVPWSIAFLPDGSALVTERRTARLLRVRQDGQVTRVGVIKGVSRDSEDSFGVTVSPTYHKDHYVFVYFTSATDNRVVRYRYDGELSDPVVIVPGIPKGYAHNGGRLAFGPDGYLYASTGDIRKTALAQDLNSLGGKILRMTAEGKPAPGNPFGSLVWTYGHRNVQGLAWDDRDRMYATEFGENTYDEINLIEKGRNYGWPMVEGMGGNPQYADPLLTWSPREASPSGLAYAAGSLWAGALHGERLWQIPLDASGRPGRPVAHFTGEYGRLRSVVTAPDGTLWVSTSNRDESRWARVRDGDDRILVVKLSQ